MAIKYSVYDQRYLLNSDYALKTTKQCNMTHTRHHLR